MPVDKFGRMSDTKTKDTGVSLTYINNNYIRSDGNTPVTGSIDMKGNTLYNVSNPVNPQDVATKDYVDKRTHIISVKGIFFFCDFIKDRYQFDFGMHGYKFDENSSPLLSEVAYSPFSGFLIPHSGHIKKNCSKNNTIIWFVV